MSDEPKDVSPSDRRELDAWEPQLPPGDFAEGVLERIKAEASADADASANANARGKARRWGAAAGVAGILALAAAIAVRVTGGAPSHGGAIAKDRAEVSIGTRARAVLEPGADVRWDGDDVVQAHGDVFYRVEPGARFRVHTPAGDVEVKGTCFTVKVRGEGTSSNSSDTGAPDMEKRDVKSGVIGAAITAFAFVAVYEGKVAVSHAGQRQDVGAGESAQIGKDGVTRSASLGEGAKSFDATAAAAGEEPYAKANENLAAQVSDYRARLEAIATQKSDLETKLKNAEAKLASVDGGGGPVRTRGEYDLDKDDWGELAKKGEVKYKSPCFRQSAWDTPPETLNKLGLAPQDAAPIKAAYEHSYQRLWAQLRPMCAAALGTSGDVVDKIGPDQCVHLIYDQAQKQDRDAAAEAHTEAALVRAGQRPEPKPGEPVNPVLKLFLLMTSAGPAFEADLAKSFGPEEAHRLFQADGICNSKNVWGGGKTEKRASE